MDLWNYNEPIANLVHVPAWIDQEITGTDVAAIVQGGCESGAYMPAVTYHQALQTMSEYGDDIFDYFDEHLGEIPPIPDSVQSWSGMAVFYLSCAVELWAVSVAEELDDA